MAQHLLVQAGAVGSFANTISSLEADVKFIARLVQDVAVQVEQATTDLGEKSKFMAEHLQGNAHAVGSLADTPGVWNWKRCSPTVDGCLGVVFENPLTVSARLYWLGPEREVYHGEMPAGSTLSVTTFVGDVWRVREGASPTGKILAQHQIDVPLGLQRKPAVKRSGGTRKARYAG